jgi:hypothetical protein
MQPLTYWRHLLPASIVMASYFRRRLLAWMRSIQLLLTPERDLFLLRYETLLVARGVSHRLNGPVRAAQGVLLNLDGFPIRQRHYLHAVIRNLNAMISENIAYQSGMAIHPDQHLLWDVPGHIRGNPQTRFAIVAIDEDLRAPPVVEAPHRLAVVAIDEVVVAPPVVLIP